MWFESSLTNLIFYHCTQVLHGSNEGSETEGTIGLKTPAWQLNLLQTLKIVWDVAKGMQFLHEMEPRLPAGRFALNSRNVMISEDVDEAFSMMTRDALNRTSNYDVGVSFLFAFSFSVFMPYYFTAMK